MDVNAHIEYRIRTVSRYVVTRFQRNVNGDGTLAQTGIHGSSQCGEYDNADTAYAVGYALAKAEHDRLGYPLDDPRIRYPEHPNHASAVEIGRAGVRLPERTSGAPIQAGTTAG